MFLISDKMINFAVLSLLKRVEHLFETGSLCELYMVLRFGLFLPRSLIDVFVYCLCIFVSVL